MVYTVFSNNGLSIIPNINLIKNIGFNDGGTHTSDQNNICADMKLVELSV